MTNSLTQGQKLGVDQQLASDNGKVLLTMQGDGNLVLYRSSDRKALWASNTPSGSISDIAKNDHEFAQQATS